MTELARASALLQQGRHRQAIDMLQPLLAREAGNAAAWQMLGMAHLLMMQYQAALAPLERARTLAPRNTRTLAMLGVAKNGLGRAGEALRHLEQAVALEPGNAALWYDRAKLEFTATRLPDALQSVDRALALQPRMAHAWLNRGLVLARLGRPDEGLANLHQALALAPADLDIRLALGEALFDARRLQDALALHQATVQAMPQHAPSWAGLGKALFELGRFDESAQAYQRSLQLHGNQDMAWVGLSRAYDALGHPDQALAALRRGAELAEIGQAPARHLFELTALAQRLAAWPTLPPLWAQVLRRIGQSASADTAFLLLAHPDATPADLLRAARADADVARRALPAAPAAPAATLATAGVQAPAAGPTRRLRVGYLSADFREHPMAFLMAGVFEAHDRARFEVVGIDISARPVPDGALRQRLLGAFDEFVPAGALSDAALASAIRAQRIDILVDLMGLTRESRLPALLQRPAPVQVNYLGFPGTCGAAELDYIIGDRWVTPAGREADFAERIVRLPDSFQANDARRPTPAPPASRAELGLPEEGFVFCCFNNSYKLLPRSFDIWMRLLAQVPGSVLWLLASHEAVAANLRAQAQARGVDPARLRFAGRRPYARYLADFQQADLFLDTLPFNAGTTASDALWAGLPVLAQLGHSFAGRMAASLLDAVGLPELITQSEADYEALALRLANEPALLRGLRERLEANRLRSPLFDTERFTRHLERAYDGMWARHAAGLPPQGFDVPALGAAP